MDSSEKVVLHEEDVRRALARIAHEIFTSAYVTAMRQTLIMPIILLAIGALSCLALKNGKPTREAAPQEAEKAPTQV